MAQGRRVERVAALIRREVSELLVNGIKDERVSLGMVSVTNVEVAGDLQHCKVHVSIYGSHTVQQEALAGLRSASGYVKGELGRRLNMRRTPEVIFQLDRGIEKGTSVLGLLNQLEQQRQERGEIPEGTGLLDAAADEGAVDGAVDRAVHRTNDGTDHAAPGREPMAAPTVPDQAQARGDGR
jgi:ribosome-binding factor A